MKFCVFVLACALANATPVPSKIPIELLHVLVTLARVRSERNTSVLPEVPAAVPEISSSPEKLALLKAYAAPESSAAHKITITPAAPVALEAPAASAALEVALKASAAPKVKEKPAPVSVSANSPSEATPILRSYVAPSEAFVSVAPVASFAPAPAFVNVPKYVANARDAQTIQYSNDISPNGTFNYFFETNNGIAAQAEGVPRSFYSGADEVSPVVEQGSFAWISPEGQEIYTSYTADENGYQPTGNAIPVAPEIPAAILRSLEFIARSRSAIASTK